MRIRLHSWFAVALSCFSFVCPATASEVVLIKDINQENSSTVEWFRDSSPSTPTVCHDAETGAPALYFVALEAAPIGPGDSPGANQVGAELWKSDGTTAGTRRIAELNNSLGIASGRGNAGAAYNRSSFLFSTPNHTNPAIVDLRCFSDEVYFAATDTVASATASISPSAFSLFKSDGLTVTLLQRSDVSGSITPKLNMQGFRTHFYEFDGRLFVLDQSGYLFRTDGIDIDPVLKSGTVQQARTSIGNGERKYFAELAGELYLIESGGAGLLRVPSGTADADVALTGIGFSNFDLTANDSHLFWRFQNVYFWQPGMATAGEIDLNPGLNDAPQQLFRVNDRVVYQATSSTGPVVVSAAGTTLASGLPYEILAQPGSGIFRPLPYTSPSTGQDWLYLYSSSKTHHCYTDGTAAGTYSPAATCTSRNGTWPNYPYAMVANAPRPMWVQATASGDYGLYVGSEGSPDVALAFSGFVPYGSRPDPVFYDHRVCLGARQHPDMSGVGRELYCAEQSELSLTVTASPTEFSMAGETIVFSYVVTNLGTASGIGGTIPDDQAIEVLETLPGAVVCDPIPTGGLLAGGSLTCSAIYTTTAADETAGSVTSSAVAEALFAYSNTASTTVDLVTNTPPVANPITTSTNEDIPVSFAADASDLDSDPLTISIVTGASNGSASWNAATGEFTYIPDPNWSGTDGFTYQANDGQEDSGVAQVTIVVDPVDDPPTPASISVAAPAAVPVDFALSASDIDSVSLSYSLASTPICASLSLSGPVVTTIPSPGCVGQTEILHFLVADATTSVPINVPLTILPPPPGSIEIVKTVDGLAPIAGQTFLFQLRQGASPTEEGTIVEFGTIEGPSDTLLFPDLPSLESYELCEASVLPGWTTSLSSEPGAFIPNSDTPGHDNSIVCIPVTLDPREDQSHTVENTSPPLPPGTARSIGFWKNHTSCDGRGQQEPVLDQTLLAAGGSLAIGALVVDSCEVAVDLLDKRQIDDPSQVFDGRKAASDAAFDLASQLLAAGLNVSANTAPCGSSETAVLEGQDLLTSIQFDGDGTFLKKKSPARARAIELAEILEAFNLNELCQ